MFPLIPIVVTLIFVGLALYIIGLIPLDPTILKLIRVLVIAAAVLWVLSLFVPMGSWFAVPHR